MDQPTYKTNEVAAFRTCSLILLTVNLLLTAFVSYDILRSRHAFFEIFLDFGTALPWQTLVVMSRWYAITLPVLAAIGVTKEVLVSNRQATLICNGAHLALILALWQFYVAGIFEPLLQLIEKLSDGR